MAVVKNKRFKIDACDISCLTAGNPEDMAVILLHGMKFKAATWEELGTLQHLADAGFYVVAVDMPGFGNSPACSLSNDRVIQELIRTVGPKQVILVGPSMGGRTALEFTLGNQAQIAALVLVGAVGVEENREHLGTISVPTLIIWGSEDRISPLSNCLLLADSITGSRKIIIDGAPHPCYLDNPDRWHTELINFLSPVA